MQNKLAHYKIKDPLGSGTFATVYRAYDTKFQLDVALKILNPIWMSNTKAIERFRQEATTMRKLRHPNIVQIYDMDIADGQLYLAEFLVEGETLAERIARAPLAWQSALKILRPIASALDYAHQQGLVHRDLKPQNILISKTGEIFISDFGLVHDTEGSVSITASSGGMLGTAAYMAPEQWRGGEPSPATDVYALTCMLIEMLTGKAHIDAPSRDAAMVQCLVDRPALPADWASDVPTDLNRVLEKGLALDPAERIQSAGDLLAQLEKISAPKPKPKPAPKPRTAPITQASITNRQSPKWLWGALAIAAVVIIMLAMALSNRPATDDGGLATTRAELAATQTAMAIAAVPQATATPIPVPPTKTAPPTKTNTPRPTATYTSVPPTKTATPTPTATRTPAPVATQVNPTTSYDYIPNIQPLPPSGSLLTKDGVMVHVPAGEFTMGSSNGDSDEQPVHTVYLDDFYIDRYEVTNAQFAQFLNTKGNQSEGGVTWLNTSYAKIHQNSNDWQIDAGYENHPVIAITWYGAQAYCTWQGKQLPTEAQWEKAARGTDGRTYPWGEGIDCNKAQYQGCGGQTVPVGTKNGVSPYGTYDMAGNVWEWVSDWYDSNYYATSPTANPTGPATGQWRVLRGGSWYYDNGYLRSADRINYYPNISKVHNGFRCVLAGSAQD